MSRMILKTVGGEHPMDIRMERRSDGSESAYVLQVGDSRTEIEIEDAGRGAGWIRIHGKVHRYHAMEREGRVDVWLDGRIHSFERVETGARRAASGEAAGPLGNAITAPMPGTLLRINVAAGDNVGAHQPLIVMESMKMELTLSAPYEGSVKEVLCTPGELVEMGKVLVKLEQRAND